MTLSNKNNKHISLNLNIRGISQSPTLEINEKSEKLIKNGLKVYKFGLGQSPFPVPIPVVERLQEHAFEKDYLPVHGLEGLRKAVSHYHREKDKVDISSDCVLIGPGSKELMFILQLVFYGDIILPTPCWVSYMPQANIIGRNVSLIHTKKENNWRLTAEELEEYLIDEHDQYKPRILVLNYPGNPTGGEYEREDLKKLVRVIKKHEIIVLSDEIYGQLHFDGMHVSIARFYPERTIISSGLSKWCGAGGWRLGTFAFPHDLKWLMNAMAAVASETYTSVSAPIQYAAIKAFKGGERIETYLSHVRRILRFIAGKIYKMLSDADVILFNPTGAFYLFLDFSHYQEILKARAITSSKKLCDRLLDETGVALLPGVSFERLPEELSARLSYVNFNGSLALRLSEDIGFENELPENFGSECLEPVFDGIEALISWLKFGADK